MKTTDPARYFRNLDTHAAALARWQEPTWHRPHFRAGIEPVSAIAARLHRIRTAKDYTGKTLAERRAYLIANQAGNPELSSPEADAPMLWIDDLDRSPLVAHAWQGREFLNHHGWFTDDFQDETLEAYAVQLVAFPHLIFEAIHHSAGGSNCIYLADFHTVDFRDSNCDYNAEEMRSDTARDAIRSADSTAEREAEKEREYQAEEQRKRDAEEARDDLKRNRSTVRALIADLKALCPTDLPTTYPAAAQALRRQLKDLLKDRSDTLDQLKTLAD